MNCVSFYGIESRFNGLLDINGRENHRNPGVCETGCNAIRKIVRMRRLEIKFAKRKV